MTVTDWGSGVFWYSGDEWRARHGDWPRAQTARPLSAITEFFAHHSGAQQTVPDVIEWLHAEFVAYVTGNNQNGTVYVDLGYNAVVTATGQIWEVRPAGVVGGHTLGHNTSGYGACYLRTAPLTAIAKLAFQKLYATVRAASGDAGLAQEYHAQVFPTACAGPDVNGWVAAGGLAGAPVPIPPPPGPGPVPPPTTRPIPGSDQMQTIVGVPTDPNGNGWARISVPFTHVQAVVVGGSDASPSDQGGDGYYYPAGRVTVSPSKRDHGATTVVSALGWPARQTATVYLVHT